MRDSVDQLTTKTFIVFVLWAMASHGGDGLQRSLKDSERIKGGYFSVESVFFHMVFVRLSLNDRVGKGCFPRVSCDIYDSCRWVYQNLQFCRE
jgi:hypothetical protein